MSVYVYTHFLFYFVLTVRSYSLKENSAFTGKYIHRYPELSVCPAFVLGTALGAPNRK